MQVEQGRKGGRFLLFFGGFRLLLYPNQKRSLKLIQRPKDSDDRVDVLFEAPKNPSLPSARKFFRSVDRLVPDSRASSLIITKHKVNCIPSQISRRQFSFQVRGKVNGSDRHSVSKDSIGVEARICGAPIDRSFVLPIMKTPSL